MSRNVTLGSLLRALSTRESLVSDSAGFACASGDFGDLVLNDLHYCTRCIEKVISNRCHQKISLPLFNEDTVSELLIDLQTAVRDEGERRTSSLFTPAPPSEMERTLIHIFTSCCIKATLTQAPRGCLPAFVLGLWMKWK